MTATRSVLRLSALLVQLMLAAASWAESPLAGQAEIDAELLLNLLGWASRLSDLALPQGGLPADALPQLQPLAPADLAATVCPNAPASCLRLVAAYNTDRRSIVYRNTLDMRDPTDQSFIVHELVHFLQHRTHGADQPVSCEAVLASERQAYDVQNAYLARFRQSQRMGEILRFSHCPGATVPAPVVNFGGLAVPHSVALPLTQPGRLSTEPVPPPAGP